MKIYVKQTSQQMGQAAAATIAEKLQKAIQEKGEARLVLSTGFSQFEVLQALVEQPVDWNRVTAFHLDEYLQLPITHKASFRKYLKERFVDKVPLREMVYVDTEGDVELHIRQVTERLREKAIDVGVIGIGENAHIAFNDPPADFGTKEAYIVVDLAEKCKKQQVGEGWFATVEEVPDQAVSMTPYQIMQCQTIVSVVPHREKAQAIKHMLDATRTDPDVPATLLKEHPDFWLYLDADSASLCTPDQLK